MLVLLTVPTLTFERSPSMYHSRGSIVENDIPISICFDVADDLLAFRSSYCHYGHG